MEVNIKPKESANLTLFDTHDIVIERDNENNATIVIHPCKIGKLSIRFVKDPYKCKLYFEVDDYDIKMIDINLNEQSDWEKIDISDIKHPKYKTENGYKEIIGVEKNMGIYSNKILLEEFITDVKDFSIIFQ